MRKIKAIKSLLQAAKNAKRDELLC